MVLRQYVGVTIATVLLTGLTVGRTLAEELVARVTLTAGSAMVEVGKVSNFIAMTVRVQNPIGTLVVNTRSDGKPVLWAPVGAADGEYRYEVVVLSYDPTVSRKPDEQEGEKVEYVRGTFTVQQGQIVAPQPGRESLGQWQGLTHEVMQLTAKVFDLLVPSAHALDLTILDLSPALLFEDLDTPLLNPDWQIQASDSLNNGSLIIMDDDDSTSTATLLLRRGANSSNSIDLQSNGDLQLVNGNALITRSGTMKLGAITGGSEELDIFSTNPEIGLVDQSDGSAMGIQYDAGEFAIEGNDGQQDIVRILGDSPANSLFIGSTGRVGMGTTSPLGRLHVVDNVDANSFIWVQNPVAGASAAAVLRAQSDVAVMNFQAHANTRTLARFGQTLGGWGEFLQVQGNGLAIGAVPNVPFILGTNNTQRVRITAAGVQVFGTFTNSSSREYKEDIQALTAEEALEGLKGLEPVKFRFTEQSEENLGFIAEDVPDVVAVEGRKSVAPMDLIALLTKVVKEQQKTIADLDKKVAKLEQHR